MRFVRLAPLSLVLLAGCVPMAAPDVPVTTSNLVSSSGAVIGTVRVFSEPTGVTLRIDAAGLPPGIHGVHVHTVARCDPPDFKSAGAHWNPTSRQHGHQNPNGWHAGDLGNLGVGADGRLVAGLLVTLGWFTRPAAFVASGTMAVAYWMAHGSQNFFPVNNMGDAAILYCFVFLYFVFAGPGAFSVDGRSTHIEVTDDQRL